MFYESHDVLSNFVFRCFECLYNMKKFEEQTNVSFPFEIHLLEETKLLGCSTHANKKEKQNIQHITSMSDTLGI